MKERLNLTMIEAKPTDAEIFLRIASSVELSPSLRLGDVNYEVGFVRTNYSNPRNRGKYISEFRNSISSLSNVLIAKIGKKIVRFLIAYTKNEWASTEYGKIMLRNKVVQ